MLLVLVASSKLQRDVAYRGCRIQYPVLYGGARELCRSIERRNYILSLRMRTFGFRGTCSDVFDRA